jgi:hypothetical protein
MWSIEMSKHFSEAARPERQASALLAVKTLIFPKLSLVYGQRLALMYEGLDQEAVMADWANELAAISVQGITYALTHLPPTDFPPNVQQFRRLCSERPAITPRQPILDAEINTAVPAYVRDLLRRTRETRDTIEPQAVRMARAYLSRVTVPGRRTTHTERCWADHCAQIVGKFEQQLVIDGMKSARKDTPISASGEDETPP